MDRKDLPFTQLRAFEAGARNGSFTKAAGELRIAIGNVSKHVSDLEALLGVQLLSRSPRGFPTETGVILLFELHESFNRISDAIDRNRSSARPS